MYALPEDILRNAPERKDRPQRSFTSTDGGKAWQPLRGEYMVRLHLVQYVDQGELISPVLDLGQEQKGFCPLLTAVTIQSLSLTADAATPAGTEVKLVVRTGPSPVYEPALWSDWRLAGAPVPKEHRYLQWKAVLRSRDPHHTPMLRAVTVDVTRQRQAPPAWAKSLRVVSLHNEQIRSTSLPFEYEDPQHPRLVTLRRQYHLDAVVSGAKTETEKLVKLQDWVAHQWKYTPPATNYPPWDANEILRRKYGFCVQYAIVLMQSALSLGHQARFVFGYNPLAKDASGHEVCEVWSNEHRKWILLDGNQNWHYVRTPTNVPMSMLEVHDLLLWRYYPGRGVSDMDTVDRRLPADELGICYGPQLIPGTPPPDCPNHFVEGRCTVPTRWLSLFYVPRNNFLSKPYPQPKTQGCGWNWSEYWCWEDAKTPKRWLYRNFTARRSDLDWTINQVRFDVTPDKRPGLLALHLGTFTPYFDTFLTKVDQHAWFPSARTGLGSATGPHPTGNKGPQQGRSRRAYQLP